MRQRRDRSIPWSDIGSVSQPFEHSALRSPMVRLRFGGAQSGVARKTLTDGSDNGSSRGGGSRSPMPRPPIPKGVRRLS